MSSDSEVVGHEWGHFCQCAATHYSAAITNQHTIFKTFFYASLRILLGLFLGPFGKVEYFDFVNNEYGHRKAKNT